MEKERDSKIEGEKEMTGNIEISGILKSDDKNYPLKTILKLNADDYVYLQITIWGNEDEA
jgi:hypothetical protein